MARITLSSRLKTGQELASLLDSFAHRLALGVERQLFGLEGDDGAPLERLLRGARQKLLAARQHLLERDAALQRWTVEGRDVRRRRDEAAVEVRKHLVRLRNLVTGVWGRREVPRVLGLGRRTSEDPVVLLRQARQLCKRVLEPLPVTGSEGEQGRANLIPVELDFPFLAAWVGEAADALEARLEEAAFVRQEEEAAIVARREAARDFDAVYRSTREWLRSLWSVAGMAELAPLTNLGRRRRRSRASRLPVEPPVETSVTPRPPESEGLRFPQPWPAALTLSP